MAQSLAAGLSAAGSIQTHRFPSEGGRYDEAPTEQQYTHRAEPDQCP
jgi:hypothetical protein